jgi:hypothetical protein
VSAGSSREEQAEDQQSQHAEVEEHVRQCPGTEAEGDRDEADATASSNVAYRISGISVTWT